MIVSASLSTTVYAASRSRAVLVLGFLILMLMHGIRHAAASDRVVLTRADIEAFNVVNIKDLLNQVPGLKAGDSSLSIRGSSKVKVFVDGRPINDPTSTHGGIKWDTVSLKNIERIEILKGKGGVAYGDDSSGGVVLITTGGIGEFRGRVTTYAGNHRTFSANSDLSAGKDGFGAGVSAGYYTAEGFRDNMDKEKRRAGMQFSVRPRKDRFLTLSADYMDEEKGVPGLPDYPRAHARKEQDNASYLLTAGYGKWRSRTSYTRAEVINTDPDRFLDNRLRVAELIQDLRTTLPLWDWGDITCGAGMSLSWASGNAIEDQDENSRWVFSSKRFKTPWKPLTMDLGFRVNRYSDFDTAFNPEFRLAFERNAYSVEFSANRTNNTPSFYHRFRESSTTIPNPDLDMETADNLSVSLSFQANTALSGTVSIFHNRITDRITYVRGDGGIGQYQNFGKVTYKGAEFSLEWKAAGNLTVKSSYTYLDARNEETGLQLSAKAKHRANADFIYAPLPSVSVILGLKYASKVYTRSDHSKSVPEYFIGNIRGEYKHRDCELFCQLNNILDEDYFYSDGYPAPPLTWLAGLSYRF